MAAANMMRFIIAFLLSSHPEIGTTIGSMRFRISRNAQRGELNACSEIAAP
jgi:hypothetical protein